MNRFAGMFIYWYSIQNIPSVSVVVGLSNTMTFSDTLFNWCENQSVKRTGSLSALWKWPISSNFNIKQIGHLKAKSELSIFILIMIISKCHLHMGQTHIQRYSSFSGGMPYWYSPVLSRENSNWEPQFWYSQYPRPRSTDTVVYLLRISHSWLQTKSLSECDMQLSEASS